MSTRDSLVCWPQGAVDGRVALLVDQGQATLLRAPNSMLPFRFFVESFDNTAGDDGERAWEPDNKKSPEAFLPRGTKGTKRAYESALKAFQDLAREVPRCCYSKFP